MLFLIKIYSIFFPDKRYFEAGIQTIDFTIYYVMHMLILLSQCFYSQFSHKGAHYWPLVVPSRMYYCGYKKYNRLMVYPFFPVVIVQDVL